MTRIPFLGMLFAVLLTASASAQQSSSNPAFCDLDVTGFISAIEGDWKVAQLAGSMNAAGMALPLPPQPTVTLNLEFLQDVGVAFLSGQGQQMFVFPMDPALISDWMKIMPKADQNAYLTTSGGCDWNSLRSFIASTNYVLDGNLITRGTNPGGVFVGQYQQRVCAHDPFGAEFSLGNRVFMVDLSATMRKCAEFILPPGHLTMTIVARFSSGSSGIGHIYFEGKKANSRFWASAPLTFSR